MCSLLFLMSYGLALNEARRSRRIWKFTSTHSPAFDHDLVIPPQVLSSLIHVAGSTCLKWRQADERSCLSSYGQCPNQC